MFKKGDYVRSINYGYIVLVDKISGDSFSGIVVEGGDKFHKTGSTHDNWGVEYFKKIDCLKHKESEKDYHIRDVYVPKYINTDFTNKTLKIGIDFAEGCKKIMKQDFAPIKNGESYDIMQISMSEFLGINKNDTEERETGMKVADFNNFAFEFSEAVKRGREKAEENLKKYHDSKDKIKTDDKVVLRTDIAFQIPFGVNKGTILNVDLIENDRARVSTPVVSFVVPLEFLIKVEEEERFNAQNITINIAGIDFDYKNMLGAFVSEIMEDKMENVRVVRKLEDLDGLENGMGLKLKYIPATDSVLENLEIFANGKDIQHEFYKDDFYVLKSMGFKFEYKPLRTFEDVKAEMLLKCKEFKYCESNWCVMYDHSDKKFMVIYQVSNEYLGTLYFDKDTADKYCDELNEIKKSKK